MDYRVAIIIVTHNGMPWIEHCLNSCGPYQVILVDNCSEDGTVSFVNNNYQQVVVLTQDTNLGFGQANNLGIAKALSLGFENVFLLNQDAYLEPHCIEQLLNTSQEYSDFGILSPIHLNGKGTDYDAQFFKYATREKDSLPTHLADINTKKALFKVPYVNAAAWLVTKSCLQKVGGFDPLFFHYGEDNNYCQRVYYHGFNVGVLTNTFIRHDRESRSKLNIIPGSAIYFNRFERKIKSKYGDITQDNLHELKRLQKKRLNESVKSILKLNLRQFYIKFKEVLLIKRLYPLISKSRLSNSEPIIERYL